MILLDPNDGFETDLITNFNDLRTKGAYKMIIGGVEEESNNISLVDSFDFCASYNTLIDNLGSKLLFILYDFAFEEYSSPFALIWNVETTSSETQKQIQVFLEAMKQIAIPTIEANKHEEIDLDKLIEIAVLSNPLDRHNITEKQFKN